MTVVFDGRNDPNPGRFRPDFDALMTQEMKSVFWEVYLLHYDFQRSFGF